MEQREYEKRYGEIKERLQKTKEEQQECQSLLKQIIAEEDKLQSDIAVIQKKNHKMEEKWGDKPHMLAEERALLRKIAGERNQLCQSGFREFKQYMKQLSDREREYRDSLQKIQQEMEDKQTGKEKIYMEAKKFYDMLENSKLEEEEKEFRKEMVQKFVNSIFYEKNNLE